MKKTTTDKYLGPKETEVIARLSYEKASLVTREQFGSWFKFNKALLNQIIFRLKKKSILTAIKRGVYFFSPLESGPAGSSINEFLVPPVFFPKGNYYIGYSTMYNYYGFTDQLFQEMYILNTSVQRNKTIGNMRFCMIKTPQNRMYGLERIKIRDTEVFVSDRERTLVDLMLASQPVGGMGQAFEIFKDQVRGGKVDRKRLIKYALKFPSIVTRKRIGYALEQAGIKEKELAALQKSIRKTSLVPLFPSKSRKGKINKKWMVIENAS